MRKELYVVLAALLPMAVAGCSSGQAEAMGGPMAATPSSSFDQTVSPFLTTYCAGCHSGADARDGVDLAFANEADARARNAQFWGRVAGVVERGQMPPRFSNQQPTDDERAAFVEWASGVN